ncbi:MAG: HesB-like protein [Bacillota bacterium]|nr:HesB-like protein [Bacillota bacterium]
MKNIQISQEGYNEFKTFLDNCNMSDYNLRISYIGKNCSGAVFNIDRGEEQQNDIIEKINELTFYIDKDLIEEFKGFIILSNSENNGNGLELKTVLVPKSPCTVCPGC